MRLQFNGSCGDLGIIGLFIPLFDLSLDADTVLLADSLKETGVSHNDLKLSMHITKIDKGNAAMVTDVFHPACHLHFTSDISLGDLP